MIDFHTHIFPDQIADRTISYLSDICKMPPFVDGKKEALLQSMKKAGITCSVILPVVTAPRQFDSINKFALQFLDGELISFGGIHPEQENYKEKLRWIKEQGLKGIKFHPDYQNTYFNDIRYKRIISYASELDLIVLTHAGQDPFSPDDIHCTPQMIAEVLDEVKPQKLVLAHMGGNRLFDDVERHLVGRDVYFDTSYVLDKISVKQFVRMVRNHGSDKILFATDSPWTGQSEFVDCFHQMPLTENEKKQILETNAKKLLEEDFS